MIGLVGIYFFIPQLTSLKSTFVVLRHTSWWWLLLGLLTTALSLCVTVLMQYIAGRNLGSLKDITILQMARQFVNSFLPYSLGSVGLAVSFYQRLGMSRAKSFGIAMLPTILVAITTVCLMILISPISFTHLVQHIQVEHDDLWQSIGLILLVFGVFIAARIYRHKAKEFMGHAWGTLITGRGKILILSQIAGAIGLIWISVMALYISAMAAHAHLSVLNAFALYVTTWVVSNVTPTPGGIGPTEAVLVVGLSASGMSLPEAVATTILFRFLTFWSMILPGGLAFRAIRKDVFKFYHKPRAAKD
jgi:uncharacterized membrane protein YbhN (UPF0104 family)